MHILDWTALFLFFLLMVVIGFFSYAKISDAREFFVSGGRLPWWLSGISHHVSGYSGAVFVAYAAVAYTHGFTIYIWWAFTITISVTAGAFLIAPRWARLRNTVGIQSPTEYLRQRYNLPVQQLMAWSGVLLKLFDVGAKWAAIAIILNVFTGLPLWAGIVLSGGISMIYVTLGGLWAVVWTDFAQFVIQIVAGLAMFVIVLGLLDGWMTVITLWDQLPDAHGNLFHEPYTAAFAMAFLFINFLSYNGGTWNLATRYISSPSGSDARKAALLSAALYLFWPLILFFPMWAAPVLLPGLEDPSQSYALLTMELLPPGLVGLVLASMFANTMSMTSSDANTIAAVITRDILPQSTRRIRALLESRSLYVARITTFLFTLMTMIMAFYANLFGGVLGLIVMWFGALVGPVSVPMILGLIPAYRYADSRASVVSIIGGLLGFVFVRYSGFADFVQIAGPVAVSFVLYSGIALLNKITGKAVKAGVDELLEHMRLDR